MLKRPMLLSSEQKRNIAGDRFRQCEISTAAPHVSSTVTPQPRRRNSFPVVQLKEESSCQGQVT